jgi:hypothetical protein
MDNSINTELKHNEQICRDPHQGKASAFYFACRNGNLELVRLMLSTISYGDLNRLEPNGSTPLHAASFYGHTETVRLLLCERGCDRSQSNRYGLTAYEEAKTDEIRELFHRPLNMNRFCDNNEQENQQTFSIVSSLSGQTEDEIYKEIHYLGKGKYLLQSKLGRYITGMGAKHDEKERNDYENLIGYLSDRSFCVKKIHKILDDVVSKEHNQYDRCCDLLLKYYHDGNVESLLKLYSLETPFYHALSDDIAPLKYPLCLNLSTLKHRYFQGQCYRGVLMTNNDLRSYRSAFKNQGSFIRTNTFSSASIDRKVAECFSQLSLSSNNKISILMHYHFPQSCDQAINLGPINESHLPCISEYANESEILILPRTLFIVKNINEIITVDEEQQQKQYAVIYLENVLHAKQSLLSSLKLLVSKTEQSEMSFYFNSISQAEEGNSSKTMDN